MRRQLLFAAILGSLLLCAPTSRAKAETFRIEIDYMVDDTIGGHSHMPTQEELDAVIQMFACQGHTLIIEVSDQIPHYTELIRNPDDCTASLFSYDGANNSYKRLKDTWYDHAGQSGWHYCIFAHLYQDNECHTTGSSGLAEISGDDLIVTLGDFDFDTGTPFEKASTLAHEFGHNLGLTHCGVQLCTGDPLDPNNVGPRKVNLPSIMSYFYQLRGVRFNMLCQGIAPPDGGVFRDLDYSHGRMCTLREGSLDESWGTLMAKADWNCDGSIGGIHAQDLNGNSDDWCAGVDDILNVVTDYDEWSNIADVTKYKTAKQLEDVVTASCITAEEYAQVSKRVFCGKPTLQVQPCSSGEAYYVRDSGNSTNPGTCAQPMDTVAAAQARATDGSIIIVEPGTYQEGSLLLHKALRLYSVGGAILR